MQLTSSEIESFCDELGPSKVIFIYEPRSQLRAIVAVDNTACGPAIGGVRIAADVSATEVMRLARAMTLKNAAAGLPHGGGKAGIVADPKKDNKARLVREFARAICTLREYIPGPDMGSDEADMAVIHNEISRAVGLPRVLGGIPLDQIGATGYGLAQCAEVAAEAAGLSLHGATVAIEGYGSVGRHAAKFLAERGALVVAVSDTQGAIFAKSGLDIPALDEIKRKAGSVTAYERAAKYDSSALFALPCDILIPAARPDCIHVGNVGSVQARLILQGANIPITPEAEQILFEKGVVNVPDFIANAGGVICAAVEYHQGTEKFAFEQIATKIKANTREVLARSRSDNIAPRQAALALATERVHQAMSYQA